jgi:hypothetical protein
MHSQHTRRIAQIQRVEGPVDEHPLGVEHGPHRAVADEDALSERLEKGLQCQEPRAGGNRAYALTAGLEFAGGATSRSALSQTKSSLL